MQRILRAPAALTLEARDAVRHEAESALARMPDGGTLVLDLADTRSVDSAGLGALIVIQRAAARRSQTVRLRNVHQEIRALLVLSRLADLFALDNANAS